MTIHEVSYLLRYLFFLLLILFTGLLLHAAVASLRRDMRRRIRPVPGCKLMASKAVEAGDAASAPQDRIRVLPLWHTTIIGRSPACDIRLEGPDIAKRHALLYLFEGKWFLRPAGSHVEVLRNGEAVHSPALLGNLDRIGIAGREFAFLDNRSDADATELENLRQEADLSRDAGPEQQRDAAHVRIAWLLANLFTVSAAYLAVFLAPATPPDLQLWLGGGFLAFFTCVNLFVAILPRLLGGADRVLLLCLMMLAVLGLLFQARLALGGLDAESGRLTAKQLATVLDAMKTQAFSVAAGLLLLPPVAWIAAKTRLPESLGVVCAVVTPLLLVATLLFGQGAESHGATLWIRIGGYSAQLTEFAKISWLIVLAWFFKNRPNRRQQLLFAGWAAFCLLLVMLLPDMGFALIMVPTTLLVFVVMTGEYGITLAFLGSGTGLAAAAWILLPHVRRRLEGWTSLWAEVNDGNRQIVYGLQAIARGGLLGRGVGNGSPGGIPLASSDMVFALVCEELGLAAGLCLLLVFIVLWLRSARIVLVGLDGFTSGLALGIGTLLFLEATVVIGGVTGLIPLTGATLPLIAKGGSSVLAKLLLFGLLVGLSARRVRIPKPKRRGRA